jgi:hypothetical protein
MQIVVQLALIDKLRVIRTNRLKLNSYLQIGLNVDGLIDLTKGTLVNLSNNLKVLADPLQHLRHFELTN